MLDATAERAFEAYTENTAAESSTVAVPRFEQVLQDSPCLQQRKELGPQLSLKSTILFPSDLSTSLDEPQNRRNCSRTSEQPSFQQLVADNQFTLGLSDKSPSLNRESHFLSWPQNFTFQSNAVNKSVGLDTKHSCFLIKDHHSFPKKSLSTIRRNVSNTDVFDLDRTNIGIEKKDVAKSVDFSKEIEDAITRIESLIPSLQKVVNSVHSPKQKSADNLGLTNFSGSVNPTGQEDRVITNNDIGLTGKSAAPGDDTVGKQAGQMLTTCNLPLPSWVKWSRNVSCVDGEDDDDDDLLKQFKNIDIGRSNVSKTQRLVDEPLNFNVQISQVPRPKFEAGMGTSEYLKGTPSRNRSFASHKPVHIQGSRVIPRQFVCEESIEKDVNSRPCTQALSVGSTKSMSQDGTSMGDPSQHQWSPSNTRISLNRNAAIMKNMNEASHSKPVCHDQTSEETSWSSCTSSSASTQHSGSPYSSSGTYLSSETDYYDSDESEPRNEIVTRSTRRPAEVVTESSASGYDSNSSYYNSRDEYSDVGSSSPMSSAQSHEWDPHKERRKKKGKLKRLRKKLGMIFHHHHHHHYHHHYSDKDGPDAGHARSLWTRLGEMFRRTRNDDYHHHKPPNKVEKPRKSETKTLAKRKQQGGQFHALVGVLMKHMKHSKKPKQVKNGIKRLGNDRRKGKKLPWLPKIHGGRGGVKISDNKGKAKLGNYYRTKSMAAAKLVLGK